MMPQNCDLEVRSHLQSPSPVSVMTAAVKANFSTTRTKRSKKINNINMFSEVINLKLCESIHQINTLTSEIFNFC